MSVIDAMGGQRFILIMGVVIPLLILLGVLARRGTSQERTAWLFAILFALVIVAMWVWGPRFA